MDSTGVLKSDPTEQQMGPPKSPVRGAWGIRRGLPAVGTLACRRQESAVAFFFRIVVMYLTWYTHLSA